MAKRKSSVWDGTDTRGEALNGLFAGLVDKCRQTLGGDISVGAIVDANLIGLPLPALSLRYLFGGTTFPLSRMMQITGEEGSAKSAFLYDVFRWHMTYGGGAILAENENKDSPELRMGILQWNPDWIARMVKSSTHSLEDWQNLFSTAMDNCISMMDAKDGPGRTIPFCFGVDSLMSTAPQSEIDQVRKDGFAMRGYALAANLIARYMRTMPDRIRDYPFTMVGTNHLKPSTDARGLPTSNIPGGKAVKFMETFEIEMKRAYGKYDIDLLKYAFQCIHCFVSIVILARAE